MNKNLPTVSDNNLLVWDSAKSKCGGYLQKKASQSSAFSKGKWQKRYFAIPLELGPKENYQLEYFHAPDDKTPRAIMSLSGATVKISTATAFVINFSDGNSISLNADTSEVMQNWVKTLENVISVSNLRERMLSQFSGHEESGDEDQNASVDKDHHGHGEESDNFKGFRHPKEKGNYVKVSNKGWPTLRLDFDATTIPPASRERHQFVEMFCNDIAHSLGIEPNMVEVISIKSAPGMDWLSLVEFDLNLFLHDLNETDSIISANDNNTYTRKKETRKKYLKLLHEMIPDSSSILYNGYLTSRVDPSFSLNLVEKTNQLGASLGSTGQSNNLAGTFNNLNLGSTNNSMQQTFNNSSPMKSGNEIMSEDVFSENPQIMKIMQKYQNVQLPDDFINLTHFQITIFFEGRIGVISVPNPQVLTKRYCALWPFEIKSALGFMNTMQELWIEPIELIPRETATKATAIPFTPSVRFGGQLIINAIHLIPDGAYDVKCLDKRDEALNSLSPEEMDSIKETFQKCDLDGDGGISKYEMEEIIRHRTQERKNMIENKFQQYLEENELLTEEERELAEDSKLQYLQQLQESQIKLLKMFEAADLNGDGSISFTEFILAEAWWLRCTINPDRVHLF